MVNQEDSVELNHDHFGSGIVLKAYLSYLRLYLERNGLIILLLEIIFS